MPKSQSESRRTEVKPEPALEKRTRRQFTTEYKLRFIAEANAGPHGELGGDRSLRLEAGLTNIFNRDNQVGIEYEFKGDTLVANEQYALGVAPFLDLYWRF